MNEWETKMNKNKKNVVREFRNDDHSTYLSNEDQKKAMLKEDIKAKKIEEARKKIMVEPINIPVNLTIPHRPLDLSKHYIRPKNVTPREPERKPVVPEGLSFRFTQDRLRRGEILKQVDEELANDRNRKRTKSTTPIQEGLNDKSI